MNPAELEREKTYSYNVSQTKFTVKFKYETVNAYRFDNVENGVAYYLPFINVKKYINPINK